MKCKEAYTCLLTAQSPLAPPLEVRQHIERCPACRRRQQRLACLEEEIRRLSCPADRAACQSRLFEKLAELAGPLAPAETPLSPPFEGGDTGGGPALSRRRRKAARVQPLFFRLALAASVVLVFGFVAYLLISNDPAQELAGSSAPSQPPAPRGSADEGVVGRVLSSDLTLAKVSTAPEQLGALVEMAQALEAEVHRLSRAGSVEDALLVGGLYERVLYEGWLGRAESLQQNDRALLLKGLQQQLERSADQADQLPLATAASSAQALRLLATAARTTGRRLNGELPQPPELRGPAWTPARTGTSRDLLGNLVLQGLRLAGESDPLRKADLCNEVADHLVQGILLASASGDGTRAEQFGGFLGSIMDQGIAANLGRLELADPMDVRAQEAAKIEARRAQNVETLQKNLQQAPAEARPSLQRALDASSKSKEKGWKPPKGKGKMGK